MKPRRNFLELWHVFEELFAKVSREEIRRNPQLIAKTKAIIKLLGKCVTPSRTIAENGATTNKRDGDDESKSDK